MLRCNQVSINDSNGSEVLNPELLVHPQKSHLAMSPHVKISPVLQKPEEETGHIMVIRICNNIESADWIASDLHDEVTLKQ